MLVSTVGPFAKHGDVAVRAAIAAGATYLDSTGEPSVHPARLARRSTPPAERRGRDAADRHGLRLGAGRAGRRARPGARGRGRGARRRRLLRARRRARTSPAPGTKESLVGAMLDPAFAFRDGRLVTERGGARVRDFDVAGRGRPAMSVGAAEHFTLPAAFPQLREVNAYLGWFGPLTRAVALSSLATSLGPARARRAHGHAGAPASG